MVAEHLLTPRGLRSLWRESLDYRGIYAGNLQTRDRAYHQGTVWLWLIAAYVEGVRLEKDRVPELFDQLVELKKELVYHFEKEGCLNQANEVFDGDIPHTPRGCFAQAWSTAAMVSVLARKKLPVEKPRRLFKAGR